MNITNCFFEIRIIHLAAEEIFQHPTIHQEQGYQQMDYYESQFLPIG